MISPIIHKKAQVHFFPRPAIYSPGVPLRELSELGPFAAGVIGGERKSFVAWFRDGRLLTVNQPFEKLTGYARDELEKMKWPEDLMSSEMSDLIRKAMDDLDRREETGEHYGELRRKDGARVEVSAYVRRYCPENDGEPSYFSFVSDLTERKKERMAREEAEAQAELFLDLMSHDLDNMNRVSIRYLELALGTARLRPGERELIMTALGSLMNSSRMIDNVRRVRDRDRLNFP
jgi:PAS domain S-box-containing protein